MRSRALGLLAPVVLLAATGAPCLVLVDGGRPAAGVVLPADPTPVEAFAAAELVRYVEMMTGARLALVSDDPAPEGPCVVIGGPHRNAAARRWLSEDQFRAANPGPRGLLLRSLGDDALLLAASIPAGPYERERGTLYAVYSLLEELGCSFTGLAPEGEHVPELARLDVPHLDVVTVPDFARRGFTMTFSKSDPELPRLIDWMAKNRLNSILCKAKYLDDFEANVGPELQERGMLVHAGHHSFFFWVPPEGNAYWPEKYFETHPDYFALTGGERSKGYYHGKAGFSRYIDSQLCLSHPALPALVADHMLQYLQRHPHVCELGLWPQDLSSLSVGWCECEACMAEVGGYGNRTGQYVRFAGEVARLVGEARPGVRISIIGYQNTGAPPPEGVTLGPNISVILAPYHDYAHAIADPASTINAPQWRNARGWAAVAPDLAVYEYYMGVFGNRHKVFPAYAAMPADLSAWRTVGADALSTQAEVAGFWTYQFNYWVMSRLLWNADVSLDDLTRDFCTQAFGHAAAPWMVDYYTALGEAMRLRDVYRANGGPGDAFYDLFSRDLLHRCAGDLSGAMTRAEGGDRARVGWAYAAWRYSQLIAMARHSYADAVSLREEGKVRQALRELHRSSCYLHEIDDYQGRYRGRNLFHLDWAKFETGPLLSRNAALEAEIGPAPPQD